MTNEEIVNEAREVKEMNWRNEEKEIKPMIKLAQQFAVACAILSVLAENRIIAEDLFRCIPENNLQDFEKDAMTILKYIEHMEK